MATTWTTARPRCGGASTTPDARARAWSDREDEQEIVIGDSNMDAPRIKFFLTAGEAEAEQFQGRGEGAEQIGGTLLYVGDGSDDLLEPVEKCLADL